MLPTSPRTNLPPDLSVRAKRPGAGRIHIIIESLMTQHRPGAHVIAQQIKSLALSRRGSVFSRVRADHLMSLADDIMAGNPESISEQALADALLRREKANPQLFMSDAELRQSPQTPPRSEVVDPDIVKAMTPAERLDYANSNGRLIPPHLRSRVVATPSEYDSLKPRS